MIATSPPFWMNWRGDKTMFDRFTDRARKAMQLARKEASEAGHSSINRAHLILGLVGERSGVAMAVLKNMGENIDRIECAARDYFPPIPGQEAEPSILPFTPEARRALECAVAESRAMGHDYVGTEHLLLGVLTTGARFDLNPDEIRSKILEFLGDTRKKP